MGGKGTVTVGGKGTVRIREEVGRMSVRVRGRGTVRETYRQAGKEYSEEIKKIKVSREGSCGAGRGGPGANPH